MSSELKPPLRRYVLKVEIGADTREEINNALSQLFDLLMRQADSDEYHSVSGGPSYGWIVNLNHNPETNHDKYIEDVHAYLGKKKTEESKEGK